MTEKKGMFSKKDKESKKKGGFFSRFSRKKTEPESQNDPIGEKEDLKEIEPAIQSSPHVEVAGNEGDSHQPINHPEIQDQRQLAQPHVDSVVTEDDPTKHEESNIDKNPEDTTGKGRFFKRLRNGLSKTRHSLRDKLGGVLTVGRKIDEDLYEELEEMLITSDLGVQTSMDLIEKVRKSVAKKQLKDGDELKKEIKRVLLETLDRPDHPEIDLNRQPMIALIVGVNGVGKTTTIGKMATYWKKQGKKVLICAADTFRAAAVEQLQVWANRAGVDIVLKEDSSDPASVVYDALVETKTKGYDILLVDTAGRLHNNPNLMKELEKIYRIIGREFESAPHHVFLILDAITGQNGLAQAKQFVQKVAVSDLVVTKLDGTAKGGVAVAISNELNLPIRFVGVGEGQEDLLSFNAPQFVDSLFEVASSGEQEPGE